MIPKKLYSQRYPGWANNQLGWGPPGSTIGLYGCNETCDSMILTASGHILTPRDLNTVYDTAHVYERDSTGDYDLLPTTALMKAFPGAYKETWVSGYNGPLISEIVASPNKFVKLWISTPAVPTHFVIAYGLAGLTIADPWTGNIGPLYGYGGPAAVKGMIIVEHLVPAPPAPKPAPVLSPPPVAVQPAPPIPAPPPVPLPIPLPVIPTPPPPEGIDLVALLQSWLVAIFKRLAGL